MKRKSAYITSLAAGLLSSAFMLASPAFAADTHHVPTAEAASATTVQKEMKPVMTVSVVSSYFGIGTLATYKFNDPKHFRTFMNTALDKKHVKNLYEANGLNPPPEPERNFSSDILQKTLKSADATLVLDGAVTIKNKDGEVGYISNFAGWDLSDMDFSRTIIRNVDFSGANFTNSKFDKSSLENVMLAGIIAPNSSWKDIIFSTEDPTRTILGSGCIEGIVTNLSGADFSSSEFRGMNWGNANMENAILPSLIGPAVRNYGGGKTQVINTNFEGANLRGVSLRRAKISSTDMPHADASGADMSDAEFTDMGDMADMNFNENTIVFGASFNNSVPPYELLKLKEKQERKSAPAPAIN